MSAVTRLKPVPPSDDALSERQRKWLALDARRAALRKELREVGHEMSMLKPEVLAELHSWGMHDDSITEQLKGMAR